MKYRLPLLVAALILFVVFPVSAQTSDREQAIKIYQAGNDLEAILALEDLVKQKQYASDAEVINYLGLAYQNALDAKNARKMFEKAVKLQPANSVYRANLSYVYLLARQLNKSQEHARKAIELDPSNVSAYFVMGTADLWEGKPGDALAIAEKMIDVDKGFPPGYMLKSEVLVAMLGQRVSAGSAVKNEIDLLRQAVEVLETGIGNAPKQVSLKGIEEKLESIKVFYDYYSKDRTAGPGTGPVVTPVKIISKRPAQYTDSARASGQQGNIRLAVLLGANGKVLHILKLKVLGYGLDEQAMNAARQIVFEPKMLDGKPVSTVVVVDYSFSIY